MRRDRDYAYEALAEVTNADMDASRGELNVSLKSIRDQAGIDDSRVLAAEIRRHASSYRSVMGEILLTPTALAKHWRRVEAEANRPRGTNLTAHKSDECSTCGGDGMVVVDTRAPESSRWMIERGLKASTEHRIEEYAPCPECNAIEVVTRRFDGSFWKTRDPAQTRDMMRR